MNKYRSHSCGEITIKDKDKNISLSGWINKKRDHGNLLFLDLRDNYGITQCVIENNHPNFKENFGPVSTISTVAIFNAVICRTIEILIENNQHPEVLKSANL